MYPNARAVDENVNRARSAAAHRVFTQALKPLSDAPLRALSNPGRVACPVARRDPAPAPGLPSVPGCRERRRGRGVAGSVPSGRLRLGEHKRAGALWWSCPVKPNSTLPDNSANRGSAKALARNSRHGRPITERTGAEGHRPLPPCGRRNRVCTHLRSCHAVYAQRPFLRTLCVLWGRI